MKIGIDGRLIRYRRGMGNYAYHVLHALARTRVDAEFVVYLDDHAALAELPKDPRVRGRVLWPHAYPIWEQMSLVRAVRHDRPDVLHSMFNTGPIADTGSKLILTIHDVMFLLPPEQVPRSAKLYHEVGRRYRAAVARRLAPRAHHVVTDSHHSARDIERLLGVRPQRLTVAHCGIDETFLQDATHEPKTAGLTPLGASGRHGRYVFALGAIDPRKNTARIIEAFAGIRNRLDVDTRLIVAGLDESSQQHFRAVAEALQVSESVMLLGFVSNEELVALYRGATVFCYPSIYEGFGFPVLEAMACGAPVVASSTSSVGEVAGDAAELVDPFDTTSIANALIGVLRDREHAADLAKRGREHVKQFSWDGVAGILIDIYQRVASAP